LSNIPHGFELVPIASAFVNRVAPIYARLTPGGRVFGVRVEQRHCNSDGTAHGGFLLSMADAALTWGRTDAEDLPRVTLSLTAEMLAPAVAGDWLEIDVEVLRQGRSIAFANAFLRIGTKRIMRASGVFRPVPPSPQVAAPP
jgi:acyl-coenzyme A thioesterase PaaI-like protein